LIKDLISGDNYAHLFTGKDNAILNFTIRMDSYDQLPILMDNFKIKIDTTLSFYEKIEKDRVHYADIDKKTREEYSKTCFKYIDNEVEELENSIRDADFKLNSLMSEFTNTVNRKKELQSRRNSIQQNNEYRKQIGEKQEALFNSLCQHKYIKYLAIKDGFLILFTNTIFIYDNGTYYEIGRFKIKIALSTGSSSTTSINNNINITNLDRLVHGYESNMHHPHILNAGPCFGNAGHYILEAFHSHDLLQLVEILISFLSSVNTSDSAGASINNWPLVSKQRVDYIEKLENQNLNEEDAQLIEQYSPPRDELLDFFK